MGVSSSLGDQVPDATTLLKFRRIIEENGPVQEILARVNTALEADGVMMRNGSIVDATFVEAPSSTKNASGSRDPALSGAKWVVSRETLARQGREGAGLGAQHRVAQGVGPLQDRARFPHR